MLSRALRATGISCLVATLALGSLELGLRLRTGGPQGLFLGWFPGRLGLYTESAEILMPGVVPWTIKTNRFGLRGDELAVERTPNIRRIAMVGDSVTDGFFVANEDTYPAFTEACLREAGISSEVINFARGGATIDRELVVLREVVTEFKPDIVVLTFVTNDLAGLDKLSDGELFRGSLSRRDLKRGLVEAAVTRTAIGERSFDAYLRWRAPGYRSGLQETIRSAGSGQERYVLPGGGDFVTNSRRFLERFQDGDARLLTDPLSSDVERGLERYLQAWDSFMALARREGMHPVFVYFPAYPQIFDDTISTTVRARLQAHSATRGVPFLDLTPALRAKSDQVLHLAPVDYHLNPDGNRVIGDALASFLLESRLLAPAMAGGETKTSH